MWGLLLRLIAGVLLLVSGFWNLIYGIAAIAQSHVFVANAHYVFGNLRAWGWVTLIFAILLLIAGGGIMVGNQAARWFGVVVLDPDGVQVEIAPAPVRRRKPQPCDEGK